MAFSLRNTTLYQLYAGHEDDQVGRRTILIDGIIKSCVATLNAGAFFTGFFMLYGVDIVNISILTFIPYLASAVAVFAPLILERLRRRKPLLLCGKALYYLLNLFVITILPFFIHDTRILIPVSVSVIFIANVINNTCLSGFDTWFLSFLPQHVRASHFSYMVLLPSFFGLGLALLSSFFVDAFAASAIKGYIIIGVRFLLVLIGAIDIWVCSRPRECEYPRSKSHLSVADIFTLPLRCRKFMGTLGIYAAFLYAYNLSASTMSYYLLNNCGVSYTFISVMDMIYPFMLLFLQPMWRSILRRTSWLAIFGWASLTFAVSFVLYGFVNASNYIVIMLIVRSLQHVAGAGHSLAAANMIYLNTPRADQTSYISFYNVTINLAIFLSMLSGTAFIGWMGVRTLLVGTFSFSSVQILLFVTGLGLFLVAGILFKSIRRLTPNED
ncbi:MAG: hypothetical protein VB111_11175 [Clostridiaceae bacterium]|nr:hypothetical protein [Clostridiaceae bacterium]